MRNPLRPLGLRGLLRSTVAAIIGLTARNATPIDPAGDAIGANGAGWAVDVVMAGITSTVGTMDATKLVLTVTDPGYDAAGNVVTVTRTIRGIAHVRRQYPNGNSKIISTDGSKTTATVAVDDWIYAGSTITAATAEAGFYPGFSGSLTVANSSTLAYPKPIFGWINPQREVIGSSISVEAVAFHRHAKGGKQVACIKYQATDGTNSSAEVLVGDTALSSRVTQGYPPEVWPATLTITGLSQGVVSRVNAKVYPHIGNASAVLDLSSDGLAWPTLSPCTQLMFVRDAGGYGGAFAYVKVGASGGTVSATAATAQAAPYPTVEAAMAAVATWNNANRGHHTVGGATIRLMDASGSASTHTVGGGSNATGLGLLVIEKDPAATATVGVQWTGVQQLPGYLMVRNLELQGSSSGYMVVGPNTLASYCILSGCVINLPTSKPLMTWYGITAMLNTTRASASAATGSVNSLTPSGGGVASLIGCRVQTDSHNIGTFDNLPGLLCGNHIPSTAFALSVQSGGIVYNNRLFWAAFFSTTASTISGAAFVQNCGEQHTPTTSSAIAFNMFADGDLTTCTHILDMHQTVAGERSSRAYNDAGGTRVAPSGVIKLITSKYSIYDNYNLKTDTFAATAGTAVGTGNWAAYYSVGNRGNISLFGNVDRLATQAPDNGNAAGYLGGAWHQSSEYNLFRTALGFTQAQIMDMFVNWTTAPRASPTRFGDYRPKSTSNLLKGRVPAGEHVLKYDLLGVARKTDGTGAAGAFEAAP